VRVTAQEPQVEARAESPSPSPSPSLSPVAAQQVAPATTEASLPAVGVAPAPATAEQAPAAKPPAVEQAPAKAQPVKVDTAPARPAPSPTPAVVLAQTPIQEGALMSIIERAGMQLAQTDPSRLAKVQERIASEAPAPRVARERPKLPPVDAAPLVQIETRGGDSGTPPDAAR